MVSFLQHLIDYTGQPWVMWEGIRRKCEYQEMLSLRAISETGYHNSSTKMVITGPR